jgi:hypothetical protein
VLVEKDYSSDELSKWKPSDEHYEKICKAAKLGGQV